MLYNLRRQVGKSNFSLYRASVCRLVWAVVKTRDMQANPCHVKMLFFSKKKKKRRREGFSGEKESQRECTESFTRLSQEVGVRFTHIGKVVEVHVSRTPAAWGLLCMQEKPIFFFFLHIQRHFGSRIRRPYCAKKKKGFSMVAYSHVKAPKHRAPSNIRG